MAVGLMRYLVRDEISHWEIGSAGTWAMDGERAAMGTRRILAERGINLDEHRSKSIEATMLEQYHLVLTMERGHKEALRAEFPRLGYKIFLLSEMVDRNYDIKDPIGDPLEDFRLTAAEVERILLLGMPRIRELASGQLTHEKGQIRPGR